MKAKVPPPLPPKPKSIFIPQDTHSAEDGNQGTIKRCPSSGSPAKPSHVPPRPPPPRLPPQKPAVLGNGVNSFQLNGERDGSLYQQQSEQRGTNLSRKEKKDVPVSAAVCTLCVFTLCSLCCAARVTLRRTDSRAAV